MGPPEKIYKGGTRDEKRSRLRRQGRITERPVQGVKKKKGRLRKVPKLRCGATQSARRA